MSFDFVPHLKSLYPEATYAITPLDGGLVNNTVRAAKTTGGDGDGPESLILKHAPPHIAVAGPDFPFSRERQTVEATALSAFSKGNPLSTLPTKGPITIPALISHDPEKVVLALADLGPLETLWSLLSPACAALVPPQHVEEAYAGLGSRVGRFFAGLHSASTSELLSSDVPYSGILTHRLTEKIVNDVAVEPILERLDTFGIGNVEEIHRRVKEAYAAEPVLLRFCLGDFHPGSILVSSWAGQPYSSSEEDRVLAVIDWEFARLKGQGADGDMPQFLACLHCNLLSLSKDAPAYKATLAFARGLVKAYAKEADINEAGNVTDEVKWELVRACLILYGREMINQAFERKEKWAGGEAARKTMVERGAWYVEMAGRDVGEMRLNEKWEDLLMRDGGFLLGLFQLDKGTE